MRYLLVLAFALTASAQDWNLGTLQTSLVAGANLEDGRSGAQPSLGAGLDIGLSRYAAVTAIYGWNRTYALTVAFRGFDVENVTALHDLMGGIRAKRLSPFVAGLMGVTVATERFSVGKSDARSRHAEPSAGIESGIEFRVWRGLSLRASARAVRPLNLGWHGTVGFGIAYRDQSRNAR